MRKTHTTALLILTALFAAGETSAKGWRGIVPLHSTREDVRRLLGPANKQDLPHAALYEFADETAVIYFQAFPCDGCGIGWNVPVGTVTGIGVIPKSKFQKEKFLSEGTFKKDKTDSIFAYYSNEEDGLTVEEYGKTVTLLTKTVTLLTYEPGRNEAAAHCSVVRGCIADYFPQFDEYEQLTFQDEKARLDNFVFSMRERMSRGVMIVYGPNPAARMKQLKRAERAKRYVVKKRGLESLRLLIVNGGYKDTAITELQLYGIGGLVSHIYITLEKDPKQK